MTVVSTSTINGTRYLWLVRVMGKDLTGESTISEEDARMRRRYLDDLLNGDAHIRRVSIAADGGGSSEWCFKMPSGEWSAPYPNEREWVLAVFRYCGLRDQHVPDALTAYENNVGFRDYL